jgi:hypothetical protein
MSSHHLLPRPSPTGLPFLFSIVQFIVLHTVSSPSLHELLFPLSRGSSIVRAEGIYGRDDSVLGDRREWGRACQSTFAETTETAAGTVRWMRPHPFAARQVDEVCLQGPYFPLSLTAGDFPQLWKYEGDVAEVPQTVYARRCPSTAAGERGRSALSFRGRCRRRAQPKTSTNTHPR